LNKKVVKAIRLTYYDQIEKTKKPSKSVKLFFSVPSVPKTVDIGLKNYQKQNYSNPNQYNVLNVMGTDI
jgi:hypothetical protein